MLRCFGRGRRAVRLIHLSMDHCSSCRETLVASTLEILLPRRAFDDGPGAQKKRTWPTRGHPPRMAAFGCAIVALQTAGCVCGFATGVASLRRLASTAKKRRKIHNSRSRIRSCKLCHDPRHDNHYTMTPIRERKSGSGCISTCEKRYTFWRRRRRSWRSVRRGARRP